MLLSPIADISGLYLLYLNLNFLFVIPCNLVGIPLVHLNYNACQFQDISWTFSSSFSCLIARDVFLTFLSLFNNQRLLSRRQWNIAVKCMHSGV